LFINWLELVYMYSVWRQLKKVNQDQLNIKNEVGLCTISWIVFSVVYFAVSQASKASDSPELVKIMRYLVLFGILLRNLCTFGATTLFSLYAVKFKEEAQYYSDERITKNFGILNLDVVMTHRMPFSYFKTFILTHVREYEVYINLYCLIELYRDKITRLLVKLQTLRNASGNSSIISKFDPRNVHDPEYRAM
jgi:hypothetical protein